MQRIYTTVLIIGSFIIFGLMSNQVRLHYTHQRLISFCVLLVCFVVWNYILAGEIHRENR